MKVLLQVLVLCGWFWLPGYAGLAQTPDAICSPSGRSLGPSGVGSFSGCPFSADIETERSQTLADGAHIRTAHERHRNAPDEPRAVGT